MCLEQRNITEINEPQCVVASKECAYTTQSRVPSSGVLVARASALILCAASGGFLDAALVAGEPDLEPVGCVTNKNDGAFSRANGPKPSSRPAPAAASASVGGAVPATTETMPEQNTHRKKRRNENEGKIH